MRRMTVWALFDSGNGSYTKGVKALNEDGEFNIEIYPIGIDIEHKNDHFINLNLCLVIIPCLILWISYQSQI